MFTHRISQMIMSLAAVASAYWLYALVAVPWIEPHPPVASFSPTSPSPTSPPSSTTSPSSDSAAHPADRYRPILSRIFAEGSWELDHPQVMRNADMMLLINQYRPLDGGRLELTPCTVVFNPHGLAHDPAASLDGTIILQAPEGAELKFEGDFDLRAGKLGPLEAGLLRGEIAIRGTVEGQRFHIRTKNVQLGRRQIWTPHDVQFQIGQTYGSGRDLIVRMKDPASTGITAPANQWSSEIASFELVHLHQLQTMAPAAWFNGQTAERDVPPGSPHAPPLSPPLAPPLRSPGNMVPVTAQAKGSLYYDAATGLATLRENVAISVVHPRGGLDQIECDVLSAYLDVARDSGSVAPTMAASKFVTGQASIRQITAIGTPAVVRSIRNGDIRQTSDPHHRRNITRVSGQLELTPPNNISPPPPPPLPSSTAPSPTLTLTPSPTAHPPGETEPPLVFRDDQLTSNRLECHFNGDGTLSEINGIGPGQFTHQDHVPQPSHDSSSGQLGAMRSLGASWQHKFRLRTEGTNYVLALDGNIRMGGGPIGQLAAQRVEAWFGSPEPPTEAPPASPTPNSLSGLRPIRFAGEGNVSFTTPQITGKTDTLNIVFQPLPNSDPSVAADAQLEPPPSQGLVLNPPTSPTPRRQFAAEGGGEPGEGQARFALSGRDVAALVYDDGSQYQLAEVHVKQQVQFAQLAPDGRSSTLEMQGDELVLEHVSASTGNATLIGKPVQVRVGQVQLTSGNLKLDRDANTVSIQGSGTAQFPLPPQIARQYDRSTAAARLNWDDGMVFDGLTATCRGKVRIVGPAQSLSSHTLSAKLTRQIDFSQATSATRQEEVKISHLIADGDVHMENYAQSETGELMIDKMMLQKLTLDQISGDLRGMGPGWVNSVRPGTAIGIGGGETESGGLRENADQQAGLVLLHVTFQRGLDGNYQQRQLTFHDQVKAAYGPAKDWEQLAEATNGGGIGKGGLLLHCQQLQVAQTSLPLGEASLEVRALGNAMVEGTGFTARAHRMSYAQQKDLFVVEGDGRTDAELWSEPNGSGTKTRAAAQKILYWPSTQRSKVEGAKFLDLNGL